MNIIMNEDTMCDILSKLDMCVTKCNDQTKMYPTIHKSRFNFKIPKENGRLSHARCEKITRDWLEKEMQMV